MQSWILGGSTVWKADRIETERTKRSDVFSATDDRQQH